MSVTSGSIVDTSDTFVLVDFASRIVRVIGKLDGSTWASVQRAVERINVSTTNNTATTSHIRIDMADVTFIDPPALDALVELDRMQTGRGGPLRIRAASPPVAHEFARAGHSNLLIPEDTR